VSPAHDRSGLLLTLDQKVAPDKAAVIVIDVQNDFVAEDGWADRVGWECSLNQAAAERLHAFLGAARSAGVPVIFIQAIYDEIYLGAPMIERNLRRGLDSPRCITGTWGADFYRVAPEPGEPVVRKHRYSAFVETELNTVLRHLGVETLILTGVYTEGCVESTARDGYFLDYYIVMVEDCCATTSEARHRDVLERCERDFGTVSSAGEIGRIWGVG
jgi:ureidoacrylate peracid hydrolase